MKKILFGLAAVFLLLTSAAFAQTEEREFKVSPGKMLKLDLEVGGDVEIFGWDKEVVSVKIFSGGRDADDCRVEFDENSSGVIVHSFFEGRRSKNRTTRSKYEIKVPQKFNLDLNSEGGGYWLEDIEGEITGHTNGGELYLKDLKGNLRLHTNGGKVSLLESEVDGQLETNGGDFEISGVKGNLRGGTNGGDLNLTNLKGEVALSTSGGDVRVFDSELEGEVRTSSGEVDLNNVSGGLKAYTSGGRVVRQGSADDDRIVSRNRIVNQNKTKTSYGKTSNTHVSEEVDITSMGGDIVFDDAPEGARVQTMGGDIVIESAKKFVKAKTMGGDIEIGNVDGWVEAITMGGDVEVTMTGNPAEGERDVTLKSMGGDITLTLPPGISADFDLVLAYTKNSVFGRKFRIESDFELKQEETDEWENDHGSPRKYIYGTGQAGGGKNKIRIETVNGNIYLKKGK